MVFKLSPKLKRDIKKAERFFDEVCRCGSISIRGEEANITHIEAVRNSDGTIQFTERYARGNHRSERYR